MMFQDTVTTLRMEMKKTTPSRLIWQHISIPQVMKLLMEMALKELMSLVNVWISSCRLIQQRRVSIYLTCIMIS